MGNRAYLFKENVFRACDGNPCSSRDLGPVLSFLGFNHFLLRYTNALKTVLRSPKTLMAMLRIDDFDRGELGYIYLGQYKNNPNVSASLGYYINPLIRNILLGLSIFFKEKLDRVNVKQHRSVFFAPWFLKVIQFGSCPWIALS